MNRIKKISSLRCINRSKKHLLFWKFNAFIPQQKRKNYKKTVYVMLYL